MNETKSSPLTKYSTVLRTIDLQKRQQKTNIKKFSAFYYLKVHLHHFSKIKSKKESQNSRNQRFSYYFCLMIEGSGSGSIPLTNGFRIRIRRIRIWLRIRIRNTAIRVNKTAIKTNMAKDFFLQPYTVIIQQKANKLWWKCTVFLWL